MHFIDLFAQQARIRSKIEANIQGILNHGRYIMGPEVYELENRLASYVSVKHGVACSSGTDALLLALMCHDVGPGDGILTTPFTFFATAEVISLLGAVPVFVDIHSGTFNIDPEKLEKTISAIKGERLEGCPLPQPLRADSADVKLGGIVAVDLFGLPADYDRIRPVAEKHGLFLIEDAAQSFGAEYKGKKACSLTSIGCTSFFPAKPLGGYGDGGMCFTDDEEAAEKMRSLRIHGQGADKYENLRIGINGRLDSIQAAILLAKFDIFPEEIQRRQKVAEGYSDLLVHQAPGIEVPRVPDGYLSAWAQYSIMATDETHRAALLSRLERAGIPYAIYYPKPLHLQRAFAGLGYREGDFPMSESVAKRIFSLPMHPYLEKGQQERIVRHLCTDD